MPVIINGSTGISGTDGSAGTPAVQGTDGNTGLFFPAADTIAFAEGGTEVMRIDSAGNVGIGRIDPFYRLEVAGQMRTRTTSGGIIATFETNDGGSNNNNLAVVPTYGNGVVASNGIYLDLGTPGMLGFRTTAAGIANCAINSSGALLVNTLSELGRVTVRWNNVTQQGMGFQSTTETYNGSPIVFYNSSGGASGFIGQATSFVSYNTSSDYRLKENITPLTDAAARVQALKPSRFNFIADPGRTIDGFIAHEAAEVVPEAVFGEKDAVNEDGSIKAQGIDQSKLVPLLTAALQEALSRIENLEARLAAVEAR